MTAIIISIGDELVLGQTIDTNSAWLARQLAAVGYKAVAHLTVPDDQSAIEQALEESVGRCDALVISGGLGPTDDDLTRQALAAFLDEPLELNDAALENVERFFKQLRRPMPQKNSIQAMLPRSAEMIENTNGTAPGIYVNYQSGDRKTLCRIFIMPGVPKEMKMMFERSVLPRLQHAGASGAVILSRTLHTFGLGESVVAEKLGPLMDRTRNPSVGTTVSNGYVSIRINAYYDDRITAERELAAAEQACRTALSDLVWGNDEHTLPEVVAQLLIASRKTVTTAESCTGGLLAKYLTDVPGSSAYFKQGWITYSNESKSNALGVSESVLTEHGAVSEPVVLAMANSARFRAGAFYALSISGIAGPEGGTPNKPVGTVCIGLAAGYESQHLSARTFLFPGDREMIRDRSAKMALTMLRYHLLGKLLAF